MSLFTGRQEEIQKLNDLENFNRAALVVIRGRRRIGKSRLAEEFAKDKIFLPFTGLAPTEHINDQSQRDAFARQLAKNFKFPPLTFLDWQDAFEHLSNNITNKKTVILFDEISWMGAKDPTFLPKLKAWWDLSMQKFPNIVLILCGSVSTWISENIIRSTAFFGRISLDLTLDELTLSESFMFLKERGIKCSTYDIFKITSITGGVPWYLEQINSKYTIDENIKNLCYDKDGLLVKEFDLIFNDLFGNKGSIYKKILYILADGMKDLAEIRNILEYSHSGRMSEYLHNLIISGFITKHSKWSLKTGKTGRQSLYRLSDNYLRFFIKYIEPNLAKIQKKTYQEFNLSGIIGWDIMMGFQVENLLLRNRHLILKSLGIHPQDVVADNPYIQKTDSRKKGCQIDYLIQTHSNNLYICEFKFHKKEISSNIIDLMKEKIKRFSPPRGYGLCPILFHISGVSDEVYAQNYFYRIIDIANFLEG